MISISFPSSEYSSISQYTTQFLKTIDVINFRFGTPWHPRKLVYILMSEKSACDFKFVKEAEVYQISSVVSDVLFSLSSMCLSTGWSITLALKLPDNIR
jgi:hypothetical protein